MKVAFFAVALLGATAWAGAGPARADVTIIHAGTLIDGAGKAPRTNVSVVIDGQRVQSIEPGFISKDGAKVIDLSKETVLPGLIDCHVHLTAFFDGGNPIAEAVTSTNFDDAMHAVHAAQATLLAGFTTVRDVGGNAEVLVALRKAIDAGTLPGPRLWVAGPPLGPTAGHGDPHNGLDPELEHQGWSDVVVDSPDEARKEVRTLKRMGVNLIKIMPSGGVLSIGDDPKVQLMTDEEIKAVIDTAHTLGLKVAAHAHGKQAIDHAIKLGVDSIEHGTYGDAESYALYKAHGTYLVPTMLIGQSVADIARTHPEQLNPSSAKKALETVPRMVQNLHDAYNAGVKIAFGTDQGLVAHGLNAREFALMVKAGMTPMDAILASTRNAADLIGDSQDIGSIQAGRYADMVAVKGDPLTDVSVLEHTDFVMKGGFVYKSGGVATPVASP